VIAFGIDPISGSLSESYLTPEQVQSIPHERAPRLRELLAKNHCISPVGQRLQKSTQARLHFYYRDPAGTLYLSRQYLMSREGFGAKTGTTTTSFSIPMLACANAANVPASHALRRRTNHLPENWEIHSLRNRRTRSR